jgi:hypothetical protein
MFGSSGLAPSGASLNDSFAVLVLFGQHGKIKESSVIAVSVFLLRMVKTVRQMFGGASGRFK